MTGPKPIRWIKTRRVASRFYGHDATFEGQIIERREVGVYVVIGRSRGHANADAAEQAILALAKRRGLEVVNDRVALRQAEWKDRYGDD